MDLIPTTISRLEQVLSTAELERAHRFVKETDRQRYIVSHAALRSILGYYLQLDPASVAMTVRPGGKPALAECHSSNLQFNLTHSHALGMVAITAENEVGIDVEQIRSNFDIASIVMRFFSQSETTKWQRLPHEEKTVAFFRCWTRKEAYMKARGTGLSLALDRFEVPFGPDEPVELLSCHDESGDSISRWTLQDISPDENYAAACVVEQEIDHVLEFDWTADVSKSELS